MPPKEPKTVDTRKPCQGKNPQGRACKFKVTPGHLYCGVHKNQIDELNVKVRTQAVRIDYANSQIEVDDYWLPLRLFFSEDKEWCVDALNLYHWHKNGNRQVKLFSLQEFTFTPMGDGSNYMFDTRDPNAQ
mgnify:CR=1 FL=1